MAFRYVLNTYIEHPEAHDTIFYDDDYVVVKDAFPKARLHWLILPRDKTITIQHPLIILKNNEELYKKTKVLVDEFVNKAAQELNVDRSHIKAGVHSVPSLANLHIHIISRDMYSDRLKTALHYNTFTTEFFINYEDIPNASVDLSMAEQRVKKANLICIYCGSDFKRSMAKLKIHLEEEYKDHYVL